MHTNSPNQQVKTNGWSGSEMVLRKPPDEHCFSQSWNFQHNNITINNQNNLATSRSSSVTSLPISDPMVVDEEYETKEEEEATSRTFREPLAVIEETPERHSIDRQSRLLADEKDGEEAASISPTPTIVISEVVSSSSSEEEEDTKTLKENGNFY